MQIPSLSLSPAVEQQLLARGCPLEPLPEESGDQACDRIDTALMAMFRDTGGREAFDALYEHSRARVFQWLRWVVREQQARLDPLDLLQDTYVNVYRYAHSFRSESGASFRAWVRTIAANVVRRARAAAPRRWVSGTAELAPEIVDRAVGPQLRLVQGEEAQALRAGWLVFLQLYAQAFERLSERDRLALELVEVQGLSYAATGERLGVGPSNMKMIMLRARRRLNAHLRAALGVEEPGESAEVLRSERCSA